MTKSLIKKIRMPDGYTILYSETNEVNYTSTLSTLALPENLLSSPTHHELLPVQCKQFGTSIRHLSPVPFPNEFDEYSFVLTSAPNEPIKLFSVKPSQTQLIHSYTWQNPRTEAFLSPYSISFSQEHYRFVAGEKSRFSVFDCNQGQSGPIATYQLRADADLGRDYLCRMKPGIVSAMDVSSSNTLAIGTTGRQVSLFDDAGLAGPRGCIATVDLTDETGCGVAQIRWSSCGKYLVVGEMKSEILSIWDMRNTHKRLQVLDGGGERSWVAKSWDLTPNDEVWAGGHDGNIRIWKDAGLRDGRSSPSQICKAHDGKYQSLLCIGMLISISRSGCCLFSAPKRGSCGDGLLQG